MDLHKPPHKWKETWTHVLKRAPFSELEALFSLSDWQSFPNAEGLNKLIAQYSFQTNSKTQTQIQFVCQSELDKKLQDEQQNQYYELYIANNNEVPTRPESWHDLFNGLVWLQFPKTKKLLNQWHVQDITEFGLSPRTIRRNNITHFDECGVVLAVKDSEKDILALLKQHLWSQAFVENRHKWGNDIEAFVFGHANYEMLLNPFIGLTGKWIAVVVEDDFFSLRSQEKRHLLDIALRNQLSTQQDLYDKGSLHPLPLLGIPHWFNENKQASFYQNTAYFRPLKSLKLGPESIL